MSERFTDLLHERAAPLWEAQHRHPFVRGIADGTLPRPAFLRWIRQDYLYLIEYGRVLALTASRAPDLPTMTRLVEIAHTTLSVEMDLHRAYAGEYGISVAELEAEEKAPATRAYTDFLLRTAALGSFEEAVAALLPCFWGFYEIGVTLSREARSEEHPYAAWIEMYSAPEFGELAEWCRVLLDGLADGASPALRQAMETAFLVSSRYELDFWDMAWNP